MSPDPVPLPLDQVPSPCFIVDAEALRRNGRILQSVRERSGAQVILALKGFAMHPAFPVLRPFLDGTTASSLNEALLGSLEFGGDLHVYAVAYRPDEFPRILDLAAHITFNSLDHWRRFRHLAAQRPDVACGIRINPEYSEVQTDLYNPCLPGSRFGMTADDLDGADLSGITGLHFHTLCEQDSDTLERTLLHLEERFAPLLHQMDWLNMGGGHHITRPGYDLHRLVRCVQRIRDTYHLDVILEPGEAAALHAGWLLAEVLDVFTTRGHHHAILDISATAHMPDVLEMPYRPHILHSALPGEKTHTYKIGGVSCLSGDRVGDYSFDTPLHPGDRLVFTDMAIYSMVKTTHFNGVAHPDIALWDPHHGGLTLTRRFGYRDFRDRLG